MSRTRRAVAVLLLCALCAGARSESDNLISSELIQAETVNYKTETVRKGVYERVYSASGSEYYPFVYRLSFETNGAKFGEYLVKRGDAVKAGDPLASFMLDADEVALSQKQLSLARAQESFARQKASMEESITLLRGQMALTADRFDREILSLRITRQELALEQYIYQQNRQMDDLREEIAEIEQRNAQNLLLSPADGVISDLTYKRHGDRVYNWEVLVTLYRDEGMLVRIDNSTGNFRYGMDVVVEVGPAKSRVVLTGRVVGADTLLPENRRSGSAFILLDPFNEEEVRFLNPTVRGSGIYLENALMLPRRALVLESGKYYVTKLTDGIVQKRYVQYVMNNTTDVWVLQGVSEGETIILD